MGGIVILHMWEWSKIEVGIEERGIGVFIVNHLSSDFNRLSDFGFTVVPMSHLQMAEKGCSKVTTCSHWKITSLSLDPSRVNYFWALTGRSADASTDMGADHGPDFHLGQSSHPTRELSNIVEIITKHILWARYYSNGLTSINSFNPQNPIM